jgi:hypothetical protein
MRLPFGRHMIQILRLGKMNEGGGDDNVSCEGSCKFFCRGIA